MSEGLGLSKGLNGGGLLPGPPGKKQCEEMIKYLVVAIFKFEILVRHSWEDVKKSDE